MTTAARANARHHGVRRTVAAGLATLALATAAVAARPTPAPAAGEGWLTVLNAYRASAGLPAVAEDPAWTAAVTQHARYTNAVMRIEHDEDRGNPLYDPVAAAAAQRSLVAGWWGGHQSQREMVEFWWNAPFHVMHLLAPGLRRTAFGWIEQENPAGNAAVLDIAQGLDRKVTARVPILFPGPGTVVPLVSYTGEVPDPLTGCPGYGDPAGLPVVALFPAPLSGVPETSLTADGQPVAHCAITGGSYANPDPAAQTLGRTVLAQKNAVVLIARLPLTPGVGYTASVRVGSQQATWSFRVATPGSALPTAVAPLPLATAAPAAAPAPKAPPTTRRKATTTRRR